MADKEGQRDKRDTSRGKASRTIEEAASGTTAAARRAGT
jgi:hypothetical protein